MLDGIEWIGRHQFNISSQNDAEFLEKSSSLFTGVPIRVDTQAIVKDLVSTESRQARQSD